MYFTDKWGIQLKLSERVTKSFNEQGTWYKETMQGHISQVVVVER